MARKQNSAGHFNAPKRQLVRWNENLDKYLMLAIQSVCNNRGIKIPWDLIAKELGPPITEGAVVQHLAKLRQRLDETGQPVPPPLRRGGIIPLNKMPRGTGVGSLGGSSRARDEGDPNDRAAKPAMKKAGNANDHNDDMDDMNDTDDDYTEAKQTMKAPRKKRSRVEDNDDAEAPVVKRRRIKVEEDVGDNEIQGALAPSAESNDHPESISKSKATSEVVTEIEDSETPRMSRKFPKPTTNILQEAFQKNPLPTRKEKEALAGLTELSSLQIHRWFKHRRRYSRDRDTTAAESGDPSRPSRAPSAVEKTKNAGRIKAPGNASNKPHILVFKLPIGLPNDPSDSHPLAKAGRNNGRNSRRSTSHNIMTNRSTAIADPETRHSLGYEMWTANSTNSEQPPTLGMPYPQGYGMQVYGHQASHGSDLPSTRHIQGNQYLGSSGSGQQSIQASPPYLEAHANGMRNFQEYGPQNGRLDLTSDRYTDPRPTRRVRGQVPSSSTFVEFPYPVHTQNSRDRDAQDTRFQARQGRGQRSRVVEDQTSDDPFLDNARQKTQAALQEPQDVNGFRGNQPFASLQYYGNGASISGAHIQNATNSGHNAASSFVFGTPPPATNPGYLSDVIEGIGGGYGINGSMWFGEDEFMQSTLNAPPGNSSTVRRFEGSAVAGTGASDTWNIRAAQEVNGDLTSASPLFGNRIRPDFESVLPMDGGIERFSSLDEQDYRPLPATEPSHESSTDPNDDNTYPWETVAYEIGILPLTPQDTYDDANFLVDAYAGVLDQPNIDDPDTAGQGEETLADAIFWE